MDIYQEGLQIEQSTKQEFIQLDGLLQTDIIRFIVNSRVSTNAFQSVVLLNTQYSSIVERLLNALFFGELSRESFNDIESQIKNARLNHLTMLEN